MAGFLIFGDGRAWAPSNAIFDVAVERVAAALPPSAQGQALARWLLDQRSSYRGPGMGRVDVRTLTPTNQQLLLDILADTFPAVPRAELRPVSPRVTLVEPLDWFLVDRLQLLGHMVAAARRGDPPEQLNPLMQGLLPRTRQHCGPGWEDGA